MADFEIPNESTDRGGDLIAAVEAYNEAVEDGLKIIHDDPEFLNAYAANYPDEATALSVKLQYYVLANNVNLGENSPIEKVSGSEFSGELVENLDSLDIFIGEYERFINLAKTPEATAQEAPKTAKKIPEIQPNSMKARLEAELGKYSFPQGTKYLVTETRASRVGLVSDDSAMVEGTYGGQAEAEFTHPALPGVKLILVQNEDEDEGVHFKSDADNVFGYSGFNFLENGMEEACENVDLALKALLYVQNKNLTTESDTPFSIQVSGLLLFDGEPLPELFPHTVEGDYASFANLLNDQYRKLNVKPPQPAEEASEVNATPNDISRLNLEMNQIFDDTMRLLSQWEGLNAEAPVNIDGFTYGDQLHKAYSRYVQATREPANFEEARSAYFSFLRTRNTLQSELNAPNTTTSSTAAPESNTAANPPNRSGDLAPEASQATFRAQLTENTDATEKDTSKPSYELTAPDASGVQELTIHLPTPKYVKDSRITDFVGMEGVAIQKTEEELGKMTLVLLADAHGQKAGTEYTWKEGTWRNAQGERLKIYDGTKIKIQNPAPTVALAEAAAPVEDSPPTETPANPDEKFDPKEFNWLAQKDENEVDMPDNRTDQEKADSLAAEYRGLIKDEKEAPRDSKGRVDSYIRARYDSYQQRLAQFKSTISDQHALLAQLADAEKGTTQFLAENPEEEAAA